MSSQEGAAPPPQGVVPNFENPQDVLHTINLISQILSIVSVSIFMFLRTYVKARVVPPFQPDDWVAVVAWVLSVAYSATALVMHYYGGGYHAWEISKANLIGFKKVTVRRDSFLSDVRKLTSSLGLYVDTLVYGPNSYFTKLALLLIITRVFRTFRKTVIGTYAIIIFMTGYYVPVLAIKSVICRPVAGFWDPDVEADCFNQRAIFVADTAVSAITDLAVLCLPIPVAITLRMSWSKRLKVLAMLSAGGIATAASIVRMILVVGLQKSDDEPVDFIRFNLLGTAEVSIGMICACLPAVNILIMRGCDFSANSSRGTGRSFFGPIELKFLKGSKLQTQNLTNMMRTEFEADSGSPSDQNAQAREASRDAIFPIERLNRLGPIETNTTATTRPDSWYTKVTSPTFSGPASPEWARKAFDETGGPLDLESGGKREEG
ncbi:Satratoxin biosynthesis SC1 cluster protein 4 [Colletotrichum trifolii]|uniref:Satratoxin biosynthesis SC1 cluster protein 4 n=1 Tax=Colletotrichum trifolii TaxID=5466 RepID=A0A4R8RH39_COLTR|nr:Satratoxin biosynthesis SC1 cluster protein 4 [Colletotrichum trifolii]